MVNLNLPQCMTVCPVMDWHPALCRPTRILWISKEDGWNDGSMLKVPLLSGGGVDVPGVGRVGDKPIRSPAANYG